jgi:predicted Na+-dependent transporter
LTSLLISLQSWLSRHIFQGVLLFLACGYFVPLEPSSPLKLLIMILFAYMTFTSGLSSSLRGFLKIACKPAIPLYTLCVIHIATPLVAWIVGHLFFPEQPLVQLGYLISGTIPVGVTSLIWTSIGRGNISLSIVTVTIDTLIAPVLLPVFILFIAGVNIQIDYSQMVRDLVLMITIPCLAGMLLHDATHGKAEQFSKGFGGILSRFSLFGVIFLNSSFVSSSIRGNIHVLKILAATCSVVSIGYILGYVAGRVIHAEPDVILSIIYTTGMRNLTTGLVIATNYFTPETALPIALGMLFQQPFAALTLNLFRRRHPLAEPVIAPN